MSESKVNAISFSLILGGTGVLNENTSAVVSLDYFLCLYCMGIRQLYFFKNYFETFYDKQTVKVQKKILWTFKVIQELDQIPETYLKHLKNTSGLYEIRVQVGNNIFRIFCFFDIDNLVVIGHGFQKKTQKTP